jgi:predicted nucleic acid-binding protein
MADRWVVNASPVILLGKAGVIHLLPLLCDELVVPAGVVAVLDDRAARRMAAQQGVPVVGSLRVIVKAKELGLIPAARPMLEKLRGSGAYVSDDLIDRAIALAGET